MTDSTLDDRRELHDRLRERALAMGGEKKLKARAAAGILNARERVDRLFDEGTFQEAGLFGVSHRPDMRERTPADGKVTGFGQIDGNTVGVISNDFTVLGASSSRTNARKIKHVKRVAGRQGYPIVFLGESSGARMPDAMGAEGTVANSDDPAQYLRRRNSPWVSAVLGPCYGSSSWYASMSDFVVMRKGAVLAVSSPRLTEMATSESVDPEELGGWRVHAQDSGLVDVAVDTDEEALDLVKRFLSYLPQNRNEPPPVAAVPTGADDPARAERIATLVPTSRSRVYNMRTVLECIVDPDSLFELKRLYGRPIITALARIDGQTVGIIASNPLVKGGAIDPEACSKATSFLVLCDSFNVPLVFIADQPGFLIGKDGERKGATGRVMNWMNALSLVTVPRIAIVARKTYGQALLNMGLGGNADETCAWTTAEINFMDPRFGARIVHGRDVIDDAQRYEAAVAEMTHGTSAYDAAGVFAVGGVIDPRQTRAYLTSALRVHSRRVGEHHLANWPTTIY
ncbi:carboxyl transferase domain-containing protein [Micromonospora sp. NPDC051196]|uniref:acyl-CoA carboxylase subunit beta n=1 Tax=Micromonospora sp. NPDC051196 TaxID=3155281 RepID=UPI003442DD24